MTDNNEGGSRPSGSALQQPSRLQPAPSAEERTIASEVQPAAAQEGDEEAGLRPVSADMQQFIGRQLRAVYDDVAKQPIPDRFLELMKQLDGKTGTR